MLSLSRKKALAIGLRRKTTSINMAWYCSGSTNTELIENLFKAELFQNERVKEAMLGVSRSLIPLNII
jgi:hypothetical protein